MDEHHLSLTEAAGRLDISERTARRWIKSGKLRAYKPGRDYRIPESAIQQVIEESVVLPKAENRSSREPSLFNGLEERRPLNYRTCAEALDRLCSHWQTRLTFNDLDQRSMWEFGIATEYFILPVVEQIFDAQLAELNQKYGGPPPSSASTSYPDSLMWPAVRRFMDVFVAVATAYERRFG